MKEASAYGNRRKSLFERVYFGLFEIQHNGQWVKVRSKYFNCFQCASVCGLSFVREKCKNCWDNIVIFQSMNSPNLRKKQRSRFKSAVSLPVIAVGHHIEILAGGEYDE